MGSRPLSQAEVRNLKNTVWKTPFWNPWGQITSKQPQEDPVKQVGSMVIFKSVCDFRVVWVVQCRFNEIPLKESKGKRDAVQERRISLKFEMKFWAGYPCGHLEGSSGWTSRSKTLVSSSKPWENKALPTS